MKKLATLVLGLALMASSALAQEMLLNPSFETEGDGGGSWSAQFWGDGATASGVTHGRSGAANWRSDEIVASDGTWVIMLEEQGFELPFGEVFQKHFIGESLGLMELTFSADFYLFAGANDGGNATSVLKAELGFFDESDTWMEGSQLLLNLSNVNDNRGEWITVSDSVTAPEGARAFQVTLASGTWGDENNRMLAVDNVSVIPEPGTMALLVLGLAGIAGLRRRLR